MPKVEHIRAWMRLRGAASFFAVAILYLFIAGYVEQAAEEHILDAAKEIKRRRGLDAAS